MRHVRAQEKEGKRAKEDSSSSESSEFVEIAAYNLPIEHVTDTDSVHPVEEPQSGASAPNSTYEDQSMEDFGEVEWILTEIDSHVPISSSDSEGEIPERKTTVWGALSTWSVDHGATHRQIDGLLLVLREFGHPELPLTARTLLGTTVSIAVQEKSGMKYIFLGLGAQLEFYLWISLRNAKNLNRHRDFTEPRWNPYLQEFKVRVMAITLCHSS